MVLQKSTEKISQLGIEPFGEITNQMAILISKSFRTRIDFGIVFSHGQIVLVKQFVKVHIEHIERLMSSASSKLCWICLNIRGIPLFTRSI